MTIKSIFIFLLPLTVAVACNKKKSNPVPTRMAFALNGDTIWTTNDVRTDNPQNGNIFITGTTADGQKSMSIGLTGYTGTKKTFLVDYRGPGGNMTGNTGMYKDGTTGITARTGKIVITEVNGDILRGYFDLHFLQDDMKGTFLTSSK